MDLPESGGKGSGFDLRQKLCRLAFRTRTMAPVDACELRARQVDTYVICIMHGQPRWWGESMAFSANRVDL